MGEFLKIPENFQTTDGNIAQVGVMHGRPKIFKPRENIVRKLVAVDHFSIKLQQIDYHHCFMILQFTSAQVAKMLLFLFSADTRVLHKLACFCLRVLSSSS